MHNKYLSVFTQSWAGPRKPCSWRYVPRKIPHYFNPISGHTLRPVIFSLPPLIQTASVELYSGVIKMSGIPATHRVVLDAGAAAISGSQVSALPVLFPGLLCGEAGPGGWCWPAD